MRIRKGRREKGHLAAMEAAFVGLLLVSSAVLVTTLPFPAQQGRAARAPLQDLVEDLLLGLEAVPTGDRHQTELARVLARAVQGNATAFERLVERTLPPGAECRVFLDNGQERRLLLGPDERLARESVSASRLWRPTWAYAFALPSLDVVSEVQPLQVQGYQVSQGALVKEHGVPLVATITTDLGVYQRAAVTALREAPSVSLTLLDAQGAPSFVHVDGQLRWTEEPLFHRAAAGTLPLPAAFDVPRGLEFLNVTFQGQGLPLGYVLTFTAPGQPPLEVPMPVAVPRTTVSIPSPPHGTWTVRSQGSLEDAPLLPARADLWANGTGLAGAQDFTFVLREEAGRTLARGTSVNLSLPYAFTHVDATAPVQPGWRNLRAVDGVGVLPYVYAETDQDLRDGELRLNITAKRPLNGDALYLVTAQLGGGASGRSTFLLGSPTGVTSTANPVEHEVYLSVPKPVAPGAPSTWGLVFPHPASTPGATEKVLALDLRTADGSALFDHVLGVLPGEGAWTKVSDSHLRWTGAKGVPSNQALAFLFRVQTLPGASGDEPPIHLPTRFENGQAFEAQDWERPYVHAVSIPPTVDLFGDPQPGYHAPAESTPAQRGEATLSVRAQQRGLLVHGDATYDATEWGSLSALQESTRAGLARSHLNLSQLQARPGEVVDLEVDFQGLFDDVVAPNALTVSGWNVELAVYDPAQPFLPYAQMTPSFHGRFGANGSLALVTQVTPEYVAHWALRSSVIDNPAHARLTLEVPRGAFYGPHAVVAQANFVVNDVPLSQTMVQSVRQLGVLDVVPDSGQGSTALYWVTLECWLADW